MTPRRRTPASVDPIYGQNANVLRMSEDELQGGVIDLAQLTGWRVAHFRPARMADGGWRTPVQADGKGFPDLVLVKGVRLAFRELKSDRGGVSDAQHEWLQSLGAVAGALMTCVYEGQGFTTPDISVGIWTPADWVTRSIHRFLEAP